MIPQRSERTSLAITTPLRRALGAHTSRVSRALAWHAIQSVAISVPLLVVALLAARLVDNQIDSEFLWLATGTVVASVAVALLSAGAGNTLLYTGAYDIGLDLRRQLVTSVRSAPIGAVLAKPRGEVTSIIDRDVDDIQSFINGRLPDLTSSLIGPLILAVILLVVDFVVGLAFILGFLLVALGYRSKLRMQARHVSYRSELRATQDERVVEFIQGIEVAKAFGVRSEVTSRLDESLRTYKEENLRSVRRTIPISAGLTAAASLLIGVLMAVVGWRYIEGAVDAPTAAGLLILVAGAARASLAVGSATGSIPGTAASLARINQLLDLPREPVPSRGPEPLRFDVAFEDVEFEYVPGRPVLHGASFDAPVRMTTALVGQSGAGKTTILHLLAGLWSPDSGRVTVGGVDLGLLSPDQRSDLVSIVLQDTYLPDGTVRDAITAGRDFDDAAVEAAARAARCWEVIESLPLGLDTPVGEGGNRLSGGERQRVAIARALILDTPIVCLDEATAALDATTERKLQEALAALLRDRTVLVVAHRPTTIRSADRIVVLDEGLVAEVGTYDELMQAGGVFAARTIALEESKRGLRRSS